MSKVVGDFQRVRHQVERSTASTAQKGRTNMFTRFVRRAVIGAAAILFLAQPVLAGPPKSHKAHKPHPQLTPPPAAGKPHKSHKPHPQLNPGPANPGKPHKAHKPHPTLNVPVSNHKPHKPHPTLNVPVSNHKPHKPHPTLNPTTSNHKPHKPHPT